MKRITFQKHLLLLASLLCVFAGIKTAQAQTEARSVATMEPVRNLPTSKQEWEGILKPNVLGFFEEQIYGKVPNDFKPKITVKQLEAGQTENYKRRQLEVTMVLGKTDTFKMVYLVLLPLGKTKALLAGYNFDGNHTIFPDRNILLSKSWCNMDIENGVEGFRQEAISRGSDAESWPIITILDSGCAVVTCVYHDWEPDYADAWKTGIRGVYAKQHNTKLADSEWGAIALWAYGLNNMAEVALKQFPELKGLPVYAVGHSRLGKTALWAGVRYPIFAGVFTNNSGCLGSKLNRGMRGETVGLINQKFPHWFSGNCKLWANKDSLFTYDQNLLVACLAPRHLYITSAERDANADPKGEYETWKLSLPAWNYYSPQVLQAPEKPLRNKPILNPYTGYHFRSGLHNFAYYDWAGFLKGVSKW